MSAHDESCCKEGCDDNNKESEDGTSEDGAPFLKRPSCFMSASQAFFFFCLSIFNDAIAEDLLLQLSNET